MLSIYISSLIFYNLISCLPTYQSTFCTHEPLSPLSVHFLFPFSTRKKYTLRTFFKKIKLKYFLQEAFLISAPQSFQHLQLQNIFPTGTSCVLLLYNSCPLLDCEILLVEHMLNIRNTEVN